MPAFLRTDLPTLWLLTGIFGFLAVASFIGYLMGKRAAAPSAS